MNNLRKNIIISSLCLLFGIFIISLFIYLLIEMDAPFWELLPISLLFFILVISGFLLLYSTYGIIRKKQMKKNFSYVYWILSIPLFIFQILMWWIFFQSLKLHIYEPITLLSIVFLWFAFALSGFLLLYLGFRIYKEKTLFF